MSVPKQRISGWGRSFFEDASVYAPNSELACKELILSEQLLIPRGMGRSYGDSANASVVFQTDFLDNFISFDKDRGILTVEAGVQLREILEIVVANGWFLPVTPGTGYVTVGGAIASDVHGKNHHSAGSFGQYVESIKILLGNGEIVTTSAKQNSDLFYATCGGMGLTGIILSATIRLISIRSSLISQKIIKTKSLEETCEKFDTYIQHNYSVAWIDCLAKGGGLGRGLLILGDHSDEGEFEFSIREPINLRLRPPSALLNRFSMKVFNNLYWYRAANNATNKISIPTFFYPLDLLKDWNTFYGKQGFVQYQFVLPENVGVRNLRAILEKIADSEQASFLAVLKKFGPGNSNLLSFPMAGYTLALDFKMTMLTKDLLLGLDEMILAMGGRIYLAKDSFMTELTFKRTYQNWEQFQIVREKYDALGKFCSNQSIRLGLE